ncbi:MAG: T9SS type A sorting domain-containing protein [Flavobacteriales bacterium]|nr:T9SS type A sorting domain-containing protein [Flavobacteriales bacterium]
MIRDTLATAFDLSTFKPGMVAVGPSFFDPVEWNGSNWNDTLDTRSWNGVLTALEVNLDTVTRELTLTLQALDTLTAIPVDDVFSGILPPDTVPPMGSGIFSYDIGLNSGVVHATEVLNYASIIFGLNEPIVTPYWLNTVDLMAPSSAISPLSEFTTDTTFSVTWSGTDSIQSGVRYFDTYYAVNQDTLFQSWLSATSDTSALFAGEVDSTYYFYSVAVDSVGNREEEALHFDAFTTVTIQTAVGSFASENLSLSLFPNPTTGIVTLRGRTENGCTLGVTIRNAVGQLLEQRSFRTGRGAISETIDLSRLAPGTYFATITCDGSQLLQRVIRIAE